jgi:hypothetical protein
MGAQILFFFGYFVTFITLLTLLWRITVALDRIGQKLQEISKTLSSRSEDKPK